MPQTLRKSAALAQRTYAETLESAEKTYDGNEERAHRAAFAAVKHSFEKVGNHWEPKKGGREGPSDERAKVGGHAIGVDRRAASTSKVTPRKS
jgi:cation transport regulator ChaB